MIAGACFRDSILYRSFSRGDVVFMEDEQAAGWLRFREHQNGETITFLYATEKMWSKRLRDSNGGETHSAIVEGVISEFEGPGFPLVS